MTSNAAVFLYCSVFLNCGLSISLCVSAQRYTCEVLRSANAGCNVHIERLIRQEKNFRERDEALREHASLSVATVNRLFIELLQ